MCVCVLCVCAGHLFTASLLVCAAQCQSSMLLSLWSRQCATLDAIVICRLDHEVLWNKSKPDMQASVTQRHWPSARQRQDMLQELGVWRVH